jgi:hypothetical protein
MMARYPDPHDRLAKALTALAGCEIIESNQTAWASATFSGARHRYLFGMSAHGQPGAFDNLADIEFDLPGHVVADIVLSERQNHDGIRRITIEALTVEDA